MKTNQKIINFLGITFFVILSAGAIAAGILLLKYTTNGTGIGVGVFLSVIGFLALALSALILQMTMEYIWSSYKGKIYFSVVLIYLSMWAVTFFQVWQAIPPVNFR